MLDHKEIQPAHPKGNQPWIFIGRTDVEAETSILWPPDAKSWLIGKDPDAGKDWRWEEKGTTEDEIVGWHHRLNWHEFGLTIGVGDGQGGRASCSPRCCRVGHDWATGLNWTELIDELLFSHSVCPPLCDPMGWCTPGSPILDHLPKLTQIPIHWLSDAIQQSNPLSSPSPPAFNLPQHQDLFLMSWPLQQAAKVLELQLQHQSFQWIFRIDLFRIDWFDILSVKGTYKCQL